LGKIWNVQERRKGVGHAFEKGIKKEPESHVFRELVVWMEEMWVSSKKLRGRKIKTGVGGGGGLGGVLGGVGFGLVGGRPIVF